MLVGYGCLFLLAAKVVLMHIYQIIWCPQTHTPVA
jgi:hypothetical protein